MTNYCQLIKLNNDGASLLGLGRLDDAASLLTQAIRLARSVAPQSSSTEEDINASPCKFSLDHIVLTRPAFTSPPCSEPTTLSSSRTEKSRFVYKEPIFIPEIGDLVLNIPHTAISVSIIYNLALAHHLQALETDSSVLILKAMKLYEFSHQMQTASKLLIPSAFLTMIILNNQGRIQRALGDLEGAGRYFCQLLSSTRRYKDEAEQEQETEDMFLNFLVESALQHLMLHQRTCAAAA
jgi:tetratricopeptide (TPR) repeat protein